jgi:hypothetical protein
MASNKTGQKNRTANPMRTKNGHERLGPLNIEQLEKLMAGSRKKNVAKIQRRITELKSRPNYKAPIVEVVVEETSAE